MAYQPTDPFRTPQEEEVRRQARLDNQLQPDPMLDDSGPSGMKVAMFAAAIALILGALFYGLNNSSVNQAGTDTGSRTAQTQPANPAPKANTEPGTTTGAAPARPATPSPAAPSPAAPQTNNPGTK